MRNIWKAVGAAVIVAATLAAPSGAQTIQVAIDQIYSSVGLGPGGGNPVIASWPNDPDPAPYTKHLENIQPGSYVEYRITAATAGLYTIGIEHLQPSDPHLVYTFETRAYSSPEDPYATRYATVDSKDYGQFGSFNPRVYTMEDPIRDASNNPLTVPLVAGDNILRIRVINLRHFAYPHYPILPSDLGLAGVRPTDGAFWSNVQWVSVHLTYSAPLPEMGTVSGTVTGDKPAGQLVRRALVAVNPTGKSPAELTSFWVWGAYTYTKNDGSYSLKAPVGAMEMKASRPSSYVPSGSTPVAVTVSSGTPATANATLTSIFYNDGADLVAFPQAEYFDDHNGNIGILPVDGQNGYKMGWIDPGDSVSLLVDVPQSGNYEVTDSYTNGGGQGLIRLSSDLGPTTEDTQDPFGWGSRTDKTFANSIYLAQGTQTLTLSLISGASDQDGFKLRLLSTPITVGKIQGTVTDSITGAGVANATVTTGSMTVTTDATGHYQGIATAGDNLPVTVTAPFIDTVVTGSTSLAVNDSITRNYVVTIRPHIALNTSAGNTWRVVGNTGGTVDYSGINVVDSSWDTIAVPLDWSAKYPTDDIYGWYRVHFTVPAGFTSLIPGRGVFVHLAGIDDTDVTYLNGVKIGGWGKMPNPPLDAQTDPLHTNPPTAGMPEVRYPGLDLGYSGDRMYYVDPSLLKTGDNVLAVQVFDLTLAGGIVGDVNIEVAPAKGVVTGKVTSGGVAVAGVRVTASNTSAISNDWTMTDASGAYTLPHVTTGAMVISCIKPGYLGGVKGLSVGSGSASTVNFDIAAAGDPIAPIYDEFSDGPTGWKTKWWAISLANNTPENAPTITEPGMDLNLGVTIPSSIEIDTGTAQRGSLTSQQRFSRWASVNAGRLVSALHFPEDGATQPNVIFHLNAPTADTSTGIGFSNYVELDIEGYASTGGNTVPMFQLWSDQPYGGRFDSGPIPVTGISGMEMVSPSQPLDMMIVRTGSVYDFYINNTLIRTQNLPGSLPDHRIAMYSYHASGKSVWDWVKASGVVSGTTVAGDINGNGVLDNADVVAALRIAGGLDSSTSTQVTAGNVVTDPGITLSDATKLAREINGL
ncbi:MAG TPA: carboxypeptidase regulatory-like domain-containing protein [Armatimonadota bacterium]|jgi:hypothetical protein